MGVTGASGTVVFTWPEGAFAAPPVVTATVQDTGGFLSTRITANTPTATTLLVQQAAGVTLLGIGVLAAGAAASGAAVHAVAIAP